MQCTSNLKQVALATHNYHDTNRCVPTIGGTPTRSAFVPLLPFLEQSNLEDNYNYNVPWNHADNQDIGAQVPETFQCPSAPGAGELAHTGYATTDYVYLYSPYNDTDLYNAPGNAFFQWGKRIAFRDVTDGLSNTLMFHESAGRAHWYVGKQRQPGGGNSPDLYVGYGAVWGEEREAWTSNVLGTYLAPYLVTPPASSGDQPTVTLFAGSQVLNLTNFYSAPYSFHPGGVQVALGDGSARFIPETINLDVLWGMSSCAGGEVLGDF